MIKDYTAGLLEENRIRVRNERILEALDVAKDIGYYAIITTAVVMTACRYV